MAEVLVTTNEVITFSPSLADAPAATVEAMIESATRLVEKYCNRYFLLQNTTEKYSVNRFPRIYLRRIPVASVDSISLYNLASPALMDSCNNVTGFDSETTNSTAVKMAEVVQYNLNPFSGVLNIINAPMSIIYPDSSYYEISYTGGFDVCPSPVKLAISMLTEAMYSQSRLDPSLSSERIGDYSYSKSANQLLIDPNSSVCQTLRPYVRFGINGL
jgi:hypothetical protein